MFSSLPHSPLQRLELPLFEQCGVEVWCKRDDLIDPMLSGNKWRKLKYALLAAAKDNIHTLLSFGGAYSNHLHALAAAGARFGFATRAIVRGEASSASNATLSPCRQWGMQLTFVDRQTYRRRHDPAWLASLAEPGLMLLAEGGSGPLALDGVGELVAEVPFSPDLWVLPCASGGTLAGLLKVKRPDEKVLGIAVIKGGTALRDTVTKLWPGAACDPHWRIALEHHDGGYARFSSELWQWLQTVTMQTGLPLEPVYSGKALWGLCRELAAGRIQRGSRIVFVHTGGMQGLAGLKERGLC